MTVRREATQFLQYTGTEALAFGSLGVEPGKTYEVPESQAKKLLSSGLFKVVDQVDAEPAPSAEEK